MRAAAYWLGSLGILALVYCAVQFESARLYQAAELRRFSERRIESPSVAKPSPFTTPSDTARLYPSTGSSIATLTIPRLGLTAVVIEGSQNPQLKVAPGHIPGTALPGDDGNVGIAGHRDTFFRPLRLIRKDDAIKITTLDREYRYKVVSTRIVDPSDIEVLHSVGRETLTLVTCYPFDFIGAAPKRFVIRADAADEQENHSLPDR
jgi:sortase A